MKSIKAIILLAVVIIVIDIAGLTVLKTMGSVESEMYRDLITKSLSVIGIVTVAALIIAFIISVTSRNSQQ